MIPWHVVSGMNGAIMVLPRDGLKDGRGQAAQVRHASTTSARTTSTSPGRRRQLQELRVGRRRLRRHDRGDADADPDPRGVQRRGRRAHRRERDDGQGRRDGAHRPLAGQPRHPPAPDRRPWRLRLGDRQVRQSRRQVDLETWFIRGGSAGAALYTFLQPGIYAYVNHNLIEAVELGATAHFTVGGEWNDDLMTQVQAPTPIEG